MNEAEVQGRVDAIIEQLNFAQNQARMLHGKLALLEAENRQLQEAVAMLSAQNHPANVVAT